MELQARTAPTGASDPSAASYLPGLDGLRALSVLAVLVYHANATWLPGGFLGVEVFFVISGFIITRGLALEWLRHSRISVTTFWLRRARRLLPALFLLLSGVLTYAAVFDQNALTTLRVDVLAALGYVTNWHLIYGNQSYFDSWNQPSFLRHLWSLAIEEQFYLLWPLFMFGALRLLKARATFALIVIGAAASYAAMALLSQGDGAAIDRVYYGTDTRIGALLVGSAVGFLPFSDSLGERLAKSRAAGLLGLSALILLVLVAFRMSETTSALYDGGFALTTLGAAFLILILNNPRSIASRLLGVRPLRWVGLRSYGIYLYHWPILMLSWPDLSGSLSLLLVQVAATLLGADFSYRFLELPIRRGALGRLYHSLTRQGAGWRQGFAAGFGLTGISLVGITLALVAVTARPPAVPDYLQASQFRLISPTLGEDVASLIQTVSPSQVAVAAEGPLSPPSEEDPPPKSAAEAAAEAEAAANKERCEAIRGRVYESDEERSWYLATCLQPAPRPNSGGTAGVPLPVFVATGTVQIEGGITAIGDSVMVGAGPWLAASFAGIDIDALIGRQTSEVIGLLRQRRAEGILAKTIVLHVGNNGTFTAPEFDQIMAIAGPERRVFFLSVHVPRQWQDSNNRVISEGTARYANALLIDWHTTVKGHAELFASDGVHIAAQGAVVYTGLVVNAVTH